MQENENHSSKLLLTLNQSIYNDIIFVHIGARKYSKNISKSKLFHALIENLKRDNIYINIGDDSNSYKLSELYSSGYETIKEIFTSYKSKKNEDLHCIYKNLNFSTNNHSENIKNLIFHCIDNDITLKLSNSEKEMLCKSILYNLKYKIDDDLITHIQDIYKIITNKSINYEYLNIINKYIYKEFIDLNLCSQFQFVFENHLEVLDFQDDTKEFINTFLTKLEEKYSVSIEDLGKNINLNSFINIKDMFNDTDFNFIKNNILINKIKQNNDIDYTTFDIKYYLYPLIKDDIIKSLNYGLTLSFRDYVIMSTEFFDFFTQFKFNFPNLKRMDIIKVKKL